MKLQPCQLSRLCDQAVHGRRKWIYLAANLLALGLFALCGLLWLILPPLLLMNTVLCLYLLHRHHAFGAEYQRAPRPKDALCETVLIDTSLIGEGTRLRAAAQPIQVTDGLSIRMGSGALLLGAAMTLTADELPRADRAAILSAVQALNIKPGRLRSHHPVMRREKEGPVRIVIVRDGLSSRRYYAGPAAEVARLCSAIWEEHPRPFTEHDHTRIADTERYIAQGNCRVFAWATAPEEEPPVFLGMAGVGESVHLTALKDIADLRAMGLTVMLEDAGQPDTDLDALRALLELPDHHARADLHLTAGDAVSASALGITRHVGDSLTEPVTTLRQRFHTIESTLRRYGLMMLPPLTLGLLFGAWTASLTAAAIGLYTAIALGVDLSRPAPRPLTLLTITAAALLARCFLLTQPDALARMAGGILCVCAAAGFAIRMCGAAFRLDADNRIRALVIPGAAALFCLCALLFSLPQGAALLLPLGFAALLSAVTLLLLLFEDKIFR